MSKKDKLFKINLQLFADDPKDQDADPKEEETPKEEVLTLEMVKKMIQSETDRVRTEYVKKLKASEEEKDALLKEKMTEEEKQKFELEKLQRELKEKEMNILRKELTLRTIDLLKENELPHGFKDFITAEDEESLVEKVKNLRKFWVEALNEAVEARFKQVGRKPEGGNSDDSYTGLNPWKKETFNLTKQAELLRTDPELAKQLKLQAK